jgi:hypothetical protein
LEQRLANPPIHHQTISAFESRDGAMGLWSNDSIDYTVVVAELTEASLNGGNQ